MGTTGNNRTRQALNCDEDASIEEMLETNTLERIRAELKLPMQDTLQI